MEVHPEFFTDTRKWVAEIAGRRVQADSLREMQERLGLDVRIIGYAPDGFPVSADDRGYRINDLRDAPVIGLARPTRRLAPADDRPPRARSPSPPARAGKRGGRPMGARTIAIRDALARGEGQTEIARRMGVSRGWVSQVASRFRGDKEYPS